MMNSEESETGLTASILKKDPKTHLRLKRTLFDQAERDWMWIFKKMLLFFLQSYVQCKNKQMSLIFCQ